MKEENKLIAVFMGWQYKNDWWERPVGKQMIPAVRGPSQIHFHDYWGELMPVVEKIETLGFLIEITHWTVTVIKPTDFGNEVTYCKTENTKIEAVYAAVVAFIKHFNSLNKPQ